MRSSCASSAPPMADGAWLLMVMSLKMGSLREDRRPATSKIAAIWATEKSARWLRGPALRNGGPCARCWTRSRPPMGRSERRAEMSRFRRAAGRGSVSSLVDADDPRLRGEPVLMRAIEYWRKNALSRHAICFGGCKTRFGEGGLGAAAFLLCTPAGSPTSASVSALCSTCWRVLPMDEIEQRAVRALRPVLGGAAP